MPGVRLFRHLLRLPGRVCRKIRVSATPGFAFFDTRPAHPARCVEEVEPAPRPTSRRLCPAHFDTVTATEGRPGGRGSIISTRTASSGEGVSKKSHCSGTWVRISRHTACSPCPLYRKSRTPPRGGRKTPRPRSPSERPATRRPCPGPSGPHKGLKTPHYRLTEFSRIQVIAFCWISGVSCTGTPTREPSRAAQ